MTDTAGSARARYDLDPYGRRTKTAGDLNTDLGFASTTAHGASGLSLAVFRAYDPERGRWLNEDPVGLDGGLNLYAYVDGDPINQVDPLGLWSQWHQMAAIVVPGVWLWHPTALQSAPMGWLTSSSSFWAGFGATMTSLPFTNFSLTGWANSQLGNPVNTCSAAFTAGGWSATAVQVLVGGAGGFRAATAARGTPGAVFSHAIPRAVLAQWRNNVGPGRISNLLKSLRGRSLWNGNFVSKLRHFRHDPAYFGHQLGDNYRLWGNRFPRWLQILDRIPRLPAGIAGGGLWAATSGPDCP